MSQQDGGESQRKPKCDKEQHQGDAGHDIRIQHGNVGNAHHGGTELPVHGLDSDCRRRSYDRRDQGGQKSDNQGGIPVSYTHLVQEVYLTYDSDEAGTKAALRAIPILRDVGITARIIRMEPYKDPDEFIKNLGAEAFEERIGKARNGFMFSLEILEKNYDMRCV